MVLNLTTKLGTNFLWGSNRICEKSSMSARGSALVAQRCGHQMVLCNYSCLPHESHSYFGSWPTIQSGLVSQGVGKLCPCKAALCCLDVSSWQEGTWAHKEAIALGYWVLTIGTITYWQVLRKINSRVNSSILSKGISESQKNPQNGGFNINGVLFRDPGIFVKTWFMKIRFWAGFGPPIDFETYAFKG